MSAPPSAAAAAAAVTEPEEVISSCATTAGATGVALFLSIMWSIKCAGKMHSAPETALALVVSSALFSLHCLQIVLFREPGSLGSLSSRCFFMFTGILCYSIGYIIPMFFLSFADCSYGECPPTAAAEAAWHEAFTIPPCGA